MFRGFNVKYPEYEVILPQTHLSFTMKTLNVSDEENMKGSFLTPNKSVEHLNRCIWESIVKKPDSVPDYNTFLKSITIKDREVLLYGLYHVSYGEVRNYIVPCSGPECSNKYPVTINISSTFSFNPYPEKDILTRLVKVDLPQSPGVSAFVKQPTMYDEVNALKELTFGNNSGLISQSIVVNKFEEDITTSKEPLVYSDRQDVLDAYKSLPVLDKRAIYETYYNNFGKYEMELKMKTTCPKCSHTEVVDIDIVEQFFRMVWIS